MEIDEPLFSAVLDATGYYMARLPRSYSSDLFLNEWKQPIIEKNKDYFYYKRNSVTYRMIDPLLDVIDDRKKTVGYLIMQCLKTYVSASNFHLLEDTHLPEGIISLQSYCNFTGNDFSNAFEQLKVYSERWVNNQAHISAYELIWWKKLTGVYDEWKRDKADRQRYFRQEKEKYNTSHINSNDSSDTWWKEQNKNRRAAYNETQRKAFGDWWFTIPSAERSYRQSQNK